MKARSPIEMMIDAACGHDPEPTPKLTDEQKEACAQLGRDVVSNLRTYYPDVVKTRPTTWILHLRNTIASQAEAMLRELLAPDVDAATGTADDAMWGNLSNGGLSPAGPCNGPRPEQRLAQHRQGSGETANTKMSYIITAKCRECGWKTGDASYLDICPQCQKIGTLVAGEIEEPLADDGADGARTSSRSEEGRSPVAGETATLSIGLVELERHVAGKWSEATDALSNMKEYRLNGPEMANVWAAANASRALANVRTYLESTGAIRPMLSTSVSGPCPPSLDFENHNQPSGG